MSQIKRPALGQIAHLGDFYDASTDSFSSLSLLKDPPPPAAVRRTDNPDTEVVIMSEDTYEEKFRRLRVEAELSASILSGLMSVGGVGRFLMERRRSGRTRQVSCLYKIATVHEKLNFGTFMMAPDLLNFNALRGSPGTHIVSEIEWGASSAVTARFEVEDGSDSTDVQAKLEAGLDQLNKIVGVGAAASGDLQVGRAKTSNRSAFGINVYGDFTTDKDMPTDFDSAREYIKSMPSSITASNGGKGKPLSYTLIPIQMITMMFDVEIDVHTALKRLSHDVLEQFVHLFDEWTRARQDLADYYIDAKRYGFCLPIGHLAEASQRLNRAKILEARLKEEYAEALTSVRRGVSEPKILLTLLAESRSDERCPEGLVSGIHSYRERMRFADVIQAKGAKFVGHNLTEIRESLIIANGRNDTYVFYINEAVQQQTDRWDENRKLLMELLESKEAGDQVLVCDCDLGGLLIETSYIEHYRGGGLLVKDLRAARRLLDDRCVIRCPASALDPSKNDPPNMDSLEVQEINVLILGETGVGKSTWINAFVNYLTHDTLEEAIAAGKVEHVVPYSFSYQLIDDDGEFHQYRIEAGSSPHEVDSIGGESATQKPIVHLIPLGDEIVLRLIDTPGIGDTRGIGQDALNQQQILATLQHIDKLHGILILLKPDNCRLGVMFRFCITELMTHLHRDAINNICFGFTNTRGSNYSPGDTYNPLKTLLETYKGAKMELSTHNTYCFDSESFRFLAALSQTKKQLPGLDDIEKSWNRSVKESKRLLSHWAALPGHRVKSTVSLNKARDLILAIEEPLSEVKRAAERTIMLNRQKAEELREVKLTMTELQSKLYIETLTVENFPLQKPRMVCSHEICQTRTKDDDGHGYSIYHKICHDGCRSLTGSGRVTEHLLRSCRIFDHGLKRSCRECGHDWKKHLHIRSEYRTRMERKLDPEVENMVNENSSIERLQAAALECLEREIKQCEAESRELGQASEEFARYLHQNSIVPYNYARVPLIDYQLRAGDVDKEVGGGDSDNDSSSTGVVSRENSMTSSSLRELRKTFASEEQAIRKGTTIPSGGLETAPTDERIDEILRSLLGMERWGPDLQRMVAQIETENAYIEQAFNRHLTGSGRSGSGSWAALAEQELPDPESNALVPISGPAWDRRELWIQKLLGQNEVILRDSGR
ncbi:Stonustoxin subunit alpha [Triangularia verruculosa]|uniref:Stonustoxin subunit alpha n=1 Tax=Triangularia verruculosa TaxID=2587418 RepID=A0AAN6X9W1_9PEZI|nr:Stonustoxin subunit alpha [Triangularia verruculosa]